MHKNQDGIGVLEVFLLFFVISLIIVTGWVTNKSKNSQALSTTSSQNDSSLEPSHKNTAQQLKEDPSKATIRDYPVPTNPSDLQLKPASNGYTLTWRASVGAGDIVKYQVFYQGNMIAEPTVTTFQHNLPPLPPGCDPIPLTYYVKAVDAYGGISNPSNSVTVNAGGC